MDTLLKTIQILFSIMGGVSSIVTIVGFISKQKFRNSGIEQSAPQKNNETGQPQQEVYPEGYIPKKWLQTLVRCILGGIFGAHYFYVGKTRTALIFVSAHIFACIIMGILLKVGVGRNETILTIIAITFLVYCASLVFLAAWAIKDITRICRGTFTDKNGYPLCKEPEKNTARAVIIAAGLVVLLIGLAIGGLVVSANSPSNSSLPSVKMLYNEGSKYFDKGDHDKAHEQYQKLITLYPDDSRGWLGRGNSFMVQDHYDKAIRDATMAIDLKEDDWQAYFLRGEVYRKQGEYDKAIEDFNKAIRLNKKDAAAGYHSRGLTYRKKGDYDKAIDDINEAFNKKNWLVYSIRGEAYLLQGKYDVAIEDFDEAIKLNKKDANAYHGRGLAYRKKGNYDKAIKDFNKAIKLNEKDAIPYHDRGLAYLKQKKYDKAIEDFNKAILRDSNYVLSYIDRGETYQLQGQYNAAIRDFDEAIYIDIDKKYYDIANYRRKAALSNMR